MIDRRRLLAGLGLCTVLALAGCGADGSVTLPTGLPSVTLPTTVPSVSLPAITLPTPSGRETRTIIETQTQTQTRTVTATPTPTTTAAAPAEAPSDGPTWWPWALAALVVIALLLAVLVARQRKLARWDGRLRKAQEQASWLEGSLVPQLQRLATSAEVTATWDAAQPDLLRLDSDLHALQTDAPDDDRRARAALLRERVADLTRAEGAEASVSGVLNVDELRALRSRVDAARAAVREVLPESITAAHR